MKEVVTEAKSAYTSAAKVTAAVAAGFVALGLLVSFGLPRDRRPEDELQHAA